MTAKEQELKKIQIWNPEPQEGKTLRCNPLTIMGYVEHHCYELDGSQTILIRTEPRKSVQEFLHNEISNEEKNESNSR